MVKRIVKKIRVYCPLPALIIFGLCAAAAVIHLISLTNVAFSDFFNHFISSAVRAFLAYLTGLLPFSLAETIIIFLPVIIVLMFAGSVKVAKKSGAAGARYICSLLAAVSLFYTLFVFGFATAYKGSALDVKLGIDRRDVSASELYRTAELLLKKTEELVPEIKYIYASSSVMPYSLDKMTALLNDAYAEAAKKYGFVQNLRSSIKYVMLSEPMTYTHISGVYTYYTGEANLNTNFPDYTLPFTAAHEMSHQRGIAREEEANFMAFLVCLESGDAYIRYSGYLNLFEYVFSALYGADPDAYDELLGRMEYRVRYEIIAYNEFFDKYRESVASEVSSVINDTYLKSQGQREGTKSYGLVVDLAVAYYNGAAVEPEAETEAGAVK